MKRMGLLLILCGGFLLGTLHADGLPTGSVAWRQMDERSQRLSIGWSCLAVRQVAALHMRDERLPEAVQHGFSELYMRAAIIKWEHGFSLIYRRVDEILDTTDAHSIEGVIYRWCLRLVPKIWIPSMTGLRW